MHSGSDMGFDLFRSMSTLGHSMDSISNATSLVRCARMSGKAMTRIACVHMGMTNGFGWFDIMFDHCLPKTANTNFMQIGMQYATVNLLDVLKQIRSGGFQFRP